MTTLLKRKNPFMTIGQLIGVCPVKFNVKTLNYETSPKVTIYSFIISLCLLSFYTYNIYVFASFYGLHTRGVVIVNIQCIIGFMTIFSIFMMTFKNRQRLGTVINNMNDLGSNIKILSSNDQKVRQRQIFEYFLKMFILEAVFFMALITFIQISYTFIYISMILCIVISMTILLYISGIARLTSYFTCLNKITKDLIEQINVSDKSKRIDMERLYIVWEEQINNLSVIYYELFKLTKEYSSIFELQVLFILFNAFASVIFHVSHFIKIR